MDNLELSQNQAKKLFRLIIKSKMDKDSVIKLLNSKSLYFINSVLKPKIKAINTVLKAKIIIEKAEEYREMTRKYAKNKEESCIFQINFFKNLLKVGVFKHLFLVGFEEGYIPTNEDNKYLNVNLKNYYITKLVKNEFPREPYFIEKRYCIGSSIDLYKLKYSFLIYCMTISWDSIYKLKDNALEKN